MKKIIIIVLFMLFSFCFIGNVSALSVSSGENVVVLSNVTYKLEKIDKKCSEVFDAEVLAFLQQIFDIFKFIAPLLCLALSMMDFVKAVASQDKDALAKATKTTGKRIIYAIVLFFIPDLINYLFELLGWVGTCGIR